ncbi:MAG: hypothetical protein PW788_00740 [Micavibrio sp.]|nr:hypothetical protein [Micavibrio sp.]
MMKNDFNAVSAETLVVKADDERAIALMRRAYNDIFVAAFPMPEERESLEKIEEKLRQPTHGVKRVILLAGKHLDDPDPAKAQLYGISIAYYYSADQAGLLAYNAIAPEYQQMGLGRLMVKGRIEGLEALAAEEGATLKCAVLEVNDPAKVKPEDDSMDPAKRVATFERWGAKRIPVPYVQPALAEGEEKGRSSILMAYPVQGEYPKGEAVAGFIRGIWSANNNGPVDYRQDPDYLNAMDALKNWPGFPPADAPPATPNTLANKPKSGPAAP